MPANRTGAVADPIYTKEGLSPAELARFLADFDRDGYVALPAILTPEGAQGLADELLTDATYLAWLAEQQPKGGGGGGRKGVISASGRFGQRPHNNKGPFSDQTLDAPLIKQLVCAVMREPQLCHTTFSVSLPGAPAGGFHQDHHHFRKENDWPVNRAERARDALYLQMLYYPVGFTAHDGSVCIIPGSHKLDPLAVDRRAEESAADPDAAFAEVRRSGGGPFAFETLAEFDPVPVFEGLSTKTFDFPPGSMVFLNGRTYHGFTEFAAKSGQTHRLFVNVIFKDGGPPHRLTQKVPPHWLQGAGLGQWRRQILSREPFSEDTEDSTLPNAWTQDLQASM